MHGPPLVPINSGDCQLPVLGQNPLFTELQSVGSVYWSLQIKANRRRQAPEHIFIISLIMGAGSCSIDGVRQGIKRDARRALRSDITRQTSVIWLKGS